MSRLARLEAFRLKAETAVVYEEVNGVRVAVDEVYKLVVNGREYGEVVAMPSNVEDLALGFVVSELGMGDPGEASITVRGDKIYIEAGGSPTAKLNGESCGGPAPRHRRIVHEKAYAWVDVYSVYYDFSQRTAGGLYRISAHTVAVYDLDAGAVVVAHDTSRHTAVLKAVGLAYRAGLLRDATKLAAATTGRASADMVVRLANIGTGLIITMRGPLASGLRAAKLTGVTLVSNAKKGRGRSLVLLTGRLEDDTA